MCVLGPGRCGSAAQDSGVPLEACFCVCARSGWRWGRKGELSASNVPPNGSRGCAYRRMPPGAAAKRHADRLRNRARLRPSHRSKGLALRSVQVVGAGGALPGQGAVSRRRGRAPESSAQPVAHQAGPRLCRRPKLSRRGIAAICREHRIQHGPGYRLSRRRFRLVAKPVPPGGRSGAAPAGDRLGAQGV